MSQDSHSSGGDESGGVHEAARREKLRKIEALGVDPWGGRFDGRMLIGNGVVNNVSNSGIGILGNHPVKLGMDLSLFIDLPGVEEPVCIAETRVSWVAGRRFGVELIAPKLDVQNELRFYVWNHLYRQKPKKS